MKAGIYARVSTKEQDIDKQVDELVDYCKRNNYEYESFVDKGVSGSKESRPEFNRLMEEVRLRKIDLVVVYKIDRFSRSMQHFLKIMQELKNKNIGFISITQPIDTTSSAGELLMNILACFAQFERNLIRERVKLGKDRSKKKQGRKNKKINLKTILGLKRKGLSTYKIAEEYNKRHKPFISHMTVFNVLKNYKN
ncbi:MAG: recombinase family protein [Nanoarchaeota archaeon]|nr:recombinase family protein [Nanoarchaeota archaeon]